MFDRKLVAKSVNLLDADMPRSFGYDAEDVRTGYAKDKIKEFLAPSVRTNSENAIIMAKLLRYECGYHYALFDITICFIESS